MQVYDSLTEPVGNTPLVRLRSVTRACPGRSVLAKVEYFNPGGSVKDRIALRMIEAAEAAGQLSPAARSSSRRRAIPASGWPSSPPSAATNACSSARTRWRRTRSACCAPTAPRSWSARARSRPITRTPTTAWPAGWPPRRPAAGSPTSTPIRRTRVALRDDRPGDLGPDRRAGHPLRGRDRHRRHDHRRRPVSEGGLRRPGQGDRRRPGGLGLLRRLRPPLPGRGGRRGHLAGQPTTGRSATRSSPCPTRSRS